MINQLRQFLSEDVINAYDTLDSFRSSNDEWRYKFMDNEEYSKIEDIGELSSIYWKEMINRIHIIILVSSFKTLRWIEAMDNNVTNYYGFCVALRGLIESVSDTFYTLRKVPLTIATDYMVIKKQIHKMSKFLTTHKNLESELLHFIQATRLSKKQKIQYPKYYNSKQIKEYIESMTEKDDDSIIYLYQILCGISHPSYESTSLFLFLHEGETIVCNDSLSYERNLVEAILNTQKKTITKLFTVYINNIYSILILLNKFDMKNIYSYISLENEFKKNCIWKEIETFMEKSKLKYKEALVTGKYN